MDAIIKKYVDDLTNLFYGAEVTDAKGSRLNLGDGLMMAAHMITTAKANGRRVFFIGNGGSATIASHKALDYWLAHKIRGFAFSDPAYLSCMSNDFGYANVFVKQMEIMAEQGDVLMAISSSGNSNNIIEAVAAARQHNCSVITFSGFEATNHLRQIGDLNFYTPLSHHPEHAFDKLAYDKVESAHLMLCNCILELIIHQSHQHQLDSRRSPSPSSKNILVAVDRDDTLVHDDGYFGKKDNWKDELKFYDGAVEMVKSFNDFADVVVATNQLGVARGLYGPERVEEIHNFIDTSFRAQGALINNWQYSPYAERSWAEKEGLAQNCLWLVDGFPETRKPQIGMLTAAANDLGKSLSHYKKIFVIGDKLDDIQMALNADGIGVWFYNGKNGHLWEGVKKLEATHPGRIFYVSSLAKAAELIKAKSFI